MGSVRIIALLASLVIAAPATKAADLLNGPGGMHGTCRYVESARFLLSTGHSAVYSGSPAFLWANETKIACAKAIGYLKLGHFRREIDVEMIQKCECFHARMVWYLRHPVAISSG
jgi:hypothetical protein